jgi:hypothetical protein
MYSFNKFTKFTNLFLSVFIAHSLTSYNYYLIIVFKMRNFDNDLDNGNWHTVPYTNRTRFISQPISVERRAGEEEFEKRKIYFNIIPYDDPVAIRVTDIL